MTPQEAYKTLDLAKGLGMDRVEAQFTKLKSEMETKIASTNNERLKQVYSNRLDEIEEAYAALIEHFEDGAHGGNGEQPIAHSQSSGHQTKESDSKWLLPAAIVFVGILVSVTLIFIFSSKDPSYKEVTIGNQVWMSENLNVDKFRNGDPIPQAKTDEEWGKAGENGQPAWCYYDNDPANGEKYGKLYNWYAVNDPRGLAPKGWHVPSDEEWTQLTDYLGDEQAAGTKMKSTDFWADYEGKSGNGTNESGFSGLPGGTRFTYGSFNYIGYYGYWWSSTESDTYIAWFRYLFYYNGSVSRTNTSKGNGFSVRCLRD